MAQTFQNYARRVFFNFHLTIDGIQFIALRPEF